MLGLLLTSLLFCVSNAQQGQDMSDDDFAAYVQMHDNARKDYGETFARGCVNGGAIGALTGGGFQALCIGCVTSGAGNVAEEVFFKERRKN